MNGHVPDDADVGFGVVACIGGLGFVEERQEGRCVWRR